MCFSEFVMTAAFDVVTRKIAMGADDPIIADRRFQPIEES